VYQIMDQRNQQFLTAKEGRTFAATWWLYHCDVTS